MATPKPTLRVKATDTGGSPDTSSPRSSRRAASATRRARRAKDVDEFGAKLLIVIVACLGGIFLYNMAPPGASSSSKTLGFEKDPHAAVDANKDALDRRDALDKARDQFNPKWDEQKSCNARQRCTVLHTRSS